MPTATIAPKLAAFITEMGGNPDTLTAEQLLRAQASFEGKPYVPEIIASGSLEGEAARIQSIEAIEARSEIAACNPQHEAIVASMKERGIAAGWTANKVELEILRASRPQAYAPSFSRQGGSTPQHLSASLMVKAGYSAAAEKMFGEHVMEQSRRLHHASLPDLCKAAL